MVTTLVDDSDSKNTPGTLRYAIETAERPLTVLFRVCGTIHLHKSLKIRNGNLTIDGSDAPDMGICITGPDGIQVTAENVIIRYIRSRLGPEYRTDENLTDAFTIRGPANNVSIANTEVSWGTDETFTVNGDGSKTDKNDVYHVNNITVQQCIIAEAFGHEDHEHRFAGIFTGADNDKISVIECIFIHCDSRVPRAGHYMDSTDLTIGPNIIDVRSCVFYNSGKRRGYNGESHQLPNNMNFINNCYIAGPSTKDPSIIFREIGSTNARGHFENNSIDGVVPNNPYSLVYFNNNWTKAEKKEYYNTNEFPTINSAAIPLTQMPDYVLDRAGCILPSRDRVNRRLIEDIRNRTGSLVEDRSLSIYNLPPLSFKRRASFCVTYDSAAALNDLSAIQTILRSQGYVDDDFRIWMNATKSNLIQSMEYLVEDLNPGDRLFLYICGHGKQKNDKNDDEVDNLDESIMGSDGKNLKDDRIYKELIKKVPKDVILNGVFSIDHSASMPDMRHNYHFEYNDGNYDLKYEKNDYVVNVEGTICIFSANCDSGTTSIQTYDGVEYTTLGGAFVKKATKVLRDKRSL